MVLVCLVCVAIACKLSERFYLTMGSLQTLCKFHWSVEEIKVTERSVLWELEYELVTVDVYDFVELYVSCLWAVNGEGTHTGAELMSLCTQFIDHMYLDISSMMIELDIKLRSVAVVAAAYAIYSKKPNNCGALLCWLVDMSGFSEKEIRSVANRLINFILGNKENIRMETMKELMFDV